MPQANRLKLPSESPKRQAENKAAWNGQRSANAADFFTIGYTGRTTETILSALETHGVRTLVDVRQMPVSMYRPELSKSNLRALLEQRGIHYTHRPELGVPRDIRAKAIDTGSRDVIWDWYDEHVVNPVLIDRLHYFLNSVEHPIALMCVELDPAECHRHRISLALERLGLQSFDL